MNYICHLNFSCSTHYELRMFFFRFAGGNLLLMCVISLLRIALKPSLVLKASAHMQVMVLYIMSFELPTSKASLIPLDFSADSFHPWNASVWICIKVFSVFINTLCKSTSALNMSLYVSKKPLICTFVCRPNRPRMTTWMSAICYLLHITLVWVCF